MQINRQYETEIDLRDLFFDLLYHWRSILIAALIGALLLGAYQYTTLELTHRAGKQTKEEKQFEVDLQAYRDSLKLAQSNIRTYTQQIDEKYRYLEESVYMSLDSQNEWVATRNYFVKVDPALMQAHSGSQNEDVSDYVATAYVSTLKTGLDAEEMQTLLGTGKQDYIDELVDIRSDADSNTITLTVIGASEENVTAQIDYFSDRLASFCGPQAQQVAAHELVLLNDDVFSRTDSDLSARQNEINKQLTEIQESIKTARETLNALEEKKEPTAPGKHLGRFAAIGFVLGAFLLACLYAVKYILGGRLHITDELTGRYNLSVFGRFAKSRARRPGKGLDALFEKWEFGHRGADERAILNGIAALLEERYAGKRVLLTGTVSEGALDGLVKRLRPVLNGVELEVRADFLANREAIAATGRVDAIVLVEERYASRMRDIDRAAEILEISGTDVGGCVII